MSGDIFLQTTIALFLLVLLVAAVFTDLKSHRIPNFLLLPALGPALMIHVLDAGMGGLMTAVGGLALGLAMLLPLYAMGGMGAGDVKLLGVVGSYLGPLGAVVAGLATMVAGAVLGIAIILWQRVWPLLQLHSTHLLGADMHAGRSAGARAYQSESRVTRITYAPAIAAGTLGALWYIDLLPLRLLS